MCSFDQELERNFLYCNHPSVQAIPDFKTIESLLETHVKPKNPKANLIFAKIDFSSSSIRKIHKDDLSYLKLDFFNQNTENRTLVQILAPKINYANGASASGGGGGSEGSSGLILETKAFESYLEQLQKAQI